MKRAALICSFLLLSIIAVLAVSCGGGGGGAIAATGGNNAGKRGFGGGSGSEGVKVFVNGTQVAGSNSESSSGEAENASTASYSEGIMSLDWSTMDLKLWVNGQLYFNQTLNKGDKFSIAGLKFGDSVRAEGTFKTSDGMDYLITGGIPSVQDGSKLSMYVTYTYTCNPAPGGTPTTGYYTAETGAALPAIQCLDGRTVLGWLNTTSGLSTDGKVWKNIPAGTTGNLTFALDESKSYAGAKLFNVTGKKITGLTDEGKALSVIRIPEGITEIGDNAFTTGSPDNTITSVIFPNSLEIIGSSAFKYCTALTSVAIPANVTTIGNSAFYECSNLSSVNFAENSQLTSLGQQWTFASTNISSIEIPEGVTSIPAGCFQSCPLTSISLPSTLTRIGSQAFISCVNLTAITIPASVTEIGTSVFNSCGTAPVPGHFTITMQGANPPTLVGSVFTGVQSLVVRVKAADKPRYEIDPSWRSFIYNTY